MERMLLSQVGHGRTRIPEGRLGDVNLLGHESLSRDPSGERCCGGGGCGEQLRPRCCFLLGGAWWVALTWDVSGTHLGSVLLELGTELCVVGTEFLDTPGRHVSYRASVRAGSQCPAGGTDIIAFSCLALMISLFAMES